MATVTISLPDTLKKWIDEKVERGDFASTSDYVRALVRFDRARQSPEELTLDDLRRIVDDSRASGLSTRSIEDIRDEARREAKALGYLRD